MNDDPPDQPDQLGWPEMVAYSGLTFRRLDYWTRAGLLRTVGSATPGSGNARQWPRAEAEVARLMRVLTDPSVGFEMHAAHRHARHLVEHPGASVFLAPHLVMRESVCTSPDDCVPQAADWRAACESLVTA